MKKKPTKKTTKKKTANKCVLREVGDDKFAVHVEYPAYLALADSIGSPGAAKWKSVEELAGVHGGEEVEGRLYPKFHAHNHTSANPVGVLSQMFTFGTLHDAAVFRDEVVGYFKEAAERHPCERGVLRVHIFGADRNIYQNIPESE